jgi:hypothetical protein
VIETCRNKGMRLVGILKICLMYKMHGMENFTKEEEEEARMLYILTLQCSFEV